MQLAWTQVTAEPTKPVHDVRVLPSHWAAWHGVLSDATGHAGRMPWGVPTTGVQVPTLPATSHASHSPLQALPQQTPSTQKPLAHAPPEPQACPAVSVPWQVPPVQKAPLAQSLDVVHAAGQVADVPAQTYGEQVGAPAYPCGAVVHVPSAGAPRALEQTSHEPEHARLQQTPSVQLPDAHSRQLPCRQSTPAVSLHEPPGTFWAWHVPLAPQ